MLPLLLMLAQAVPSAPPQPDVLVVGKRIEDALELCRAGGCSVPRDVQVSIAAAERRFAEGDYRGAQAVLTDAIGRNRRHAAAHPKPVATLFEAQATVSAHHGDLELYRRSVSHQVRTLRDNLPATDPAVTVADFAAADMWVRLGKRYQYDQSLAAIVRRARARGRPRVAALAMLRRVALLDGFTQRARALEMLDEVETLAPGDADVARAARMVRLRIVARGGDDAAVDAFIAAVRPRPGEARALVWAPPYPTPEADSRHLFGLEPNPQEPPLDLQWADVGFWIRPDGRTADVEILRGSRGRNRITPLLAQVAARRYQAADTASDAPGDYRVERFSWRAVYGQKIGSLVPRRVGALRLEVLDLTGVPEKGIAPHGG